MDWSFGDGILDDSGSIGCSLDNIFDDCCTSDTVWWLSGSVEDDRFIGDVEEFSVSDSICSSFGEFVDNSWTSEDSCRSSCCIGDDWWTSEGCGWSSKTAGVVEDSCTSDGISEFVEGGIDDNFWVSVDVWRSSDRTGDVLATNVSSFAGEDSDKFWISKDVVSDCDWLVSEDADWSSGSVELVGEVETFRVSDDIW